MKRNAQELSVTIRKLLNGQTPEGYAELLEDISDSVSDIDTQNYVAKSDYDNLIQERDKYLKQANTYRDKYINRFYKAYDEANNQGLLESSSNQETVEKDEKDVSYAELFE